MKVFALYAAAAGLILFGGILGITALDAYHDIGCPAVRTDCWPTDWREVASEIALMVAAFVGCGFCVNRASRSV